MRISIPHMGNLYIPLKALFQRLDVEFIVPPLTNQRTLSLGVRYSPEGLCIPFKLTLGNLIEVAELGADTLLMPSGYGTCRLGYYARTQEQVLHDLGYDIEMIQLGVSEQKFFGLLKIIKRLSNGASWFDIISAFRFGMRKLNALDRMEKLVQKVRAVENEKGTANRLYDEVISAIDEADSDKVLEMVEEDYSIRLDQVPRDSQDRPLIVGIVGEFYVLLEPFSNFDVERELGKLGVEVRRTTFISEWIKFSLFLNPLGIKEKDRIHKAALPYLKRDIGGDGWESIGEKVLHNKEYDGLVHLAPFTCLPEIMAQNIMPTTRENIPVLTILCDEQTSKTGMLTRLEAFVDLLERKRRGSKCDRKMVAI
ncbi:MAG: acyl-CoA dehydratase activase-related protein [Dehalococcoidales bacterium]|nr:acyl-CoA dehydratase activase-related protein [Dehalococcoidales bacterium]MDP7525788.1 acyl-CoA dehydratase activase-related protein [Dehalococcoidales bacterium]